MKDETHKIFFNATAYKIEKDVEIRAFLDYIVNRKPEDNLTDKIDAFVKKIKSQETNRRQYMIEHLKIRDKIMEGKREMAIEAALNLLKEGITEDVISRCVGLPLIKIHELSETIKK